MSIHNTSRIIQSKLVQNVRLKDSIKPISCAGTLKTVKGFKSDSTASDKLKGVVVRVSRVEKTNNEDKSKEYHPTLI